MTATMNCGPGRQRGFTLIELMLAVALLALILIMLASSFGAVAHSKTHAENRLTTDQRGRAIIWQLSKELRGAIQTPFEPSRVLLLGQGRIQSGTPLDSITFSTLDVGHRRALNGFGAEETVSYSAEPNPGVRGWFILMRTQRSSLLNVAPGLKDTPPTVLADNLLALHFRYFDGSRWNESWNSQGAAAGQALPQAVSIELLMAAPGGRPVNFSTMIQIPMALTTR